MEGRRIGSRLVCVALLLASAQLGGCAQALQESAEVATGALRAFMRPEPRAIPHEKMPDPASLLTLHEPVQTIDLDDARTLRAMFNQRAWQRINDYLGTLDRSAAAGHPASELRVITAWQVMVDVEEDNLAAIEDWAAATPSNWQPHLALARYWHHAAWRERGTGAVSETEPEQLKAFRSLMATGERALAQARSIKAPALIERACANARSRKHAQSKLALLPCRRIRSITPLA